VSEIGIPMKCGHDIIHHEEVCIVCVIANETLNVLDYLRMFNAISADSEQEESRIDGFLNAAREYINQQQGPETYIIKGEQK
jgi:hypothetical protein